MITVMGYEIRGQGQFGNRFHREVAVGHTARLVRVTQTQVGRMRVNECVVSTERIASVA